MGELVFGGIDKSYYTGTLQSRPGSGQHLAMECLGGRCLAENFNMDGTLQVTMRSKPVKLPFILSIAAFKELKEFTVKTTGDVVLKLFVTSFLQVRGRSSSYGSLSNLHTNYGMMTFDDCDMETGNDLLTHAATLILVHRYTNYGMMTLDDYDMETDNEQALSVLGAERGTAEAHYMQLVDMSSLRASITQQQASSPNEWEGQVFYPNCSPEDDKLYEFIIGFASTLSSCEKYGENMESRIQSSIAKASFIYEKQLHMKLKADYLTAVEGIFTKGTVTVGSIDVKGQPFVEVSKVSFGPWNITFAAGKFDGLLGLGFKSISQFQIPTSFANPARRSYTSLAKTSWWHRPLLDSSTCAGGPSNPQDDVLYCSMRIGMALNQSIRARSTTRSHCTDIAARRHRTVTHI